MAGRILLISLCFALAISTVSSVETVNGRIKITMGTSSGCSNAVNFIRNHLVPVYSEFHEYLDVEFVPWGRTQRHPDGSMTCQFGVNDCWANRLHRCVLNHLRGNTMAQVLYMSCEFTSPFPAFRQRSFECATAAGMNVWEANFCVNNPQFDTLDQQAQVAAIEPMATINWVPFVVFNDVINVPAHWEAHQRLRQMICPALVNDDTIPITSC